jgi:hypothetical protein
MHELHNGGHKKGKNNFKTIIELSQTIEHQVDIMWGLWNQHVNYVFNLFQVQKLALLKHHKPWY